MAIIGSTSIEINIIVAAKGNNSNGSNIKFDAIEDVKKSANTNVITNKEPNNVQILSCS